METVKVTLKSRTPLLMHADSISWADKMEAWKNDPANKGKSKAGDDRTPPWKWVGYLNYDDPKDGVATVPSEYIMACIRGGAAQVLTGKGKTTFKSMSQSGMLCEDLHWPLLVNGKKIPMKAVSECLGMKTFKEQEEVANSLGFSLFSKRAPIGMSKHIRVRPRFDTWETTGTIILLEEQLTKSVLAQILEISGRTKGIGDWRPGSKTPGPFGTFTAEVN